jgi:hypothetical protein
MLMKISGLARSLYIVLAIVAGFVAIGAMNVSLALVVLGLIAGLAMPQERYLLAGVTALVLPVIGTALSQIPAVGAQLNTICGNLQMGVAGALASALAIVLYNLTIEGVTGLMGGAGAAPAAAAR